jgi:sterol 3beta-glucosyltransferase
VPTPADWPPDSIATGYWLREAGSDAEPLNPDLESFLAAGTPPIYIGFGSSVGPDPAHLAAVVSNAVQQAGVRAVIASGWGALRGVQSNSNTLVIESAPHRSLFPRVTAVVHHGGAGTTAAGLLASRPTVICPFQGDQHFWGAAVHRAGAGPQPLRDTNTGRVMHGLVSDIATNPSLARRYKEEIVDLRVRRYDEIVQYRIERGELRPDTDPAFLHELVFGPVYYQLLLSGQMLAADFAERFVDAVLPAFFPEPDRTSG